MQQSLDGLNASINRNIVECKCIPTTRPWPVNLRINRNIVECKYMSTAPGTTSSFVLIETLWNVNTDINVAARAEELY